MRRLTPVAELAAFGVEVTRLRQDRGWTIEALAEATGVKRSARGGNLWLEVRQVEEARTNPEFHIYVVENVR